MGAQMRSSAETHKQHARAFIVCVRIHNIDYIMLARVPFLHTQHCTQLQCEHILYIKTCFINIYIRAHARVHMCGYVCMLLINDITAPIDVLLFINVN